MGLEEFEERESSGLRFISEFPVKVYVYDVDTAVIRKVHQPKERNFKKYLCQGETCKFCAKGDLPRKAFWLEVYDIEAKENRILTGRQRLGQTLARQHKTLIEDGDEDGLNGKVIKIEKASKYDFVVTPLKAKVTSKPQREYLNLEQVVDNLIAKDDEEEELDTDTPELDIEDEDIEL